MRRALHLDAGDVFKREDDGEEALERHRQRREDGPDAEGVDQAVAASLVMALYRSNTFMMGRRTGA